MTPQTHLTTTQRAFVTLLTAMVALAGCSKAQVDAAADAVPSIAHTHDAVFVNGDFESGDFTGWTKGTGANYGITYPPATRADLNIKPGGGDLTYIVTGAAESQIPAGLSSGATLRVPRYGTHAAVVNQQGSGNNLNTLKQQFTAGASDVDPADGKVHVRFALAPVLNSGGHSADAQPYFWVTLTNLSKSNQVLFSTFNYSNQPGVPWKLEPTDSSTGYTDWQAFDISPGNVSLAIGDTVELEVIASGCAYGGHWGEIYVDGFGAFLPGLAVSAQAPQSANAGSDLTYTFNYSNRGTGAATNAKVRFTLPTGVSFKSVNAPGASCTQPAVGAAGDVTCNVGTVNPAGSGSFTVTTTISTGATGIVSAGNYDISADSVSALIGPLVTTTITSGVTYADLSASITDAVAALGWGQAHSFSFTVANAGPGAANGATLAWSKPANYASTSWTCTASGSAVCPAASGSGSISSTIATFPSGGSLVYAVSGTVAAGSGSSSLSNLVTVTVPSGVQDNNSNNDQAIHTDSIGTLRTITFVKAGAGGGRVVSSPAALDCGTGCTTQTVQFLDGSALSLTATADTGDTFTGWSGLCTGVANPCNVTVTADATVTATFTPPQQTVAVSTTTHGTIVCDSPVTKGADSTCVITPALGYRLATLTDNGTNVLGSVSGGQYVIHALTANHTITGTFVFACGNGIVESGETCDDGNTTSGDGCSSACAIETGYACATAGAACTPICGDGLKKGAEACDDGNTANGDGCSSSCTIESGFTCTTVGAACSPVCGDGLKRGSEGCDDGNTTPGDGCSALCALEPGFACATQGSACSAVCGDGVQTAGEGCDDGNTHNGDGCSSTCTIEAGFLCSNTATSLVTNGDFSQGNTGFTSTLSYLANGPNSAANQYGISTGNSWRSDVCSGVSVGNPSLYFNAGSDPSQILYQTTVNVTAGTDYIVELRTMSWTSSAPPQLHIALGSVDLTSDFTAVVCNASTPWTRVSASYHATATGPITLKVYDRETAAGGNDGALDDFSVRAASPSSCGHPTIDALAVVASGNQASFPVSGTCLTSASAVTVTTAGQSKTVACNAAGQWSTTFDLSARAQGAISFTASQSNAGGTASVSASTTKDSIGPTGSTLTAPTEGQPLNDATPDISGSCETGASVTVFEGSTALCTATCVASSFTCTSDTLSEGPHAVFAVQTDVYGNVGPAGGTRNFVVDLTAPTAPGVDQPVPGFATNDTSPVVSGSCESGATVQVYEDATLLCTTSCTAGAYSCHVALPTEGTHTLAVTQTDPAGNTSSPTSASVRIDLTPPAAPVIALPAAGFYSADNTPTVSGSCETDALVTVFEGSQALCTATCVSGAFACDSTVLADGSHTLTATQTDVAGNTGTTAAPRTFIVDTQVAAPTFSAPAEGAFLSTHTPALSGGCETGATVTVTEGSATLCTATCADSAWHCTPASLPEGAHTFTVGQVDLAGNVSTTSDRSLTLDVTAPAAPAITAPVTGAFVQAQTTVVSGTCEPYATVAVLEGASLLCSDTCSAGGTFSCTTPTLPEGQHALSAHQTDRAGNQGRDTALVKVTFDVTAPAAPVATAPVDGSTLGSAQPTISGTCEAFATVDVKEGSTTLCSAVCDASGSFSCRSSGLSDGHHTVTLTQTDRSHNVSAPASLGFIVDTTAPVVPTLAAPVKDAVLATATPTFSGTGEPGSTTRVLVDGQVVCSATVAEDGTWSCTSSQVLDGVHHAQVQGVDPSGNASSSSAVTPFSVDTTAPRAPSILAPAAQQTVNPYPTFEGRGEPGSTVTVSVDGQAACTAVVDVTGAWACLAWPALADGAHHAVATASDAAGNTSGASDSLPFTVSANAAPGAPVLTSPHAGGAVASGTPDFSGRASPGATVVLTVDGKVVCTVTATADGDFHCTSSVSFPDGAHSVSGTAADAHGTSQPALPTGFSIDTHAPAAPVLAQPVDQSTVGRYPLLAGTAEAGDTVTVFVDGAVVCTAKADAQARFACFGSAALTDGAHQATAQATDAAGNPGAGSAAVHFTVQSGLAPAAPALSAPSEGNVFASSTVAFAGQAEPGTTVKVVVDGNLVCQAQTGAAGDWACTGTSVGDGAHTVTATATRDTQTSDASAATHFTVDTQAPAAPVVTAPVSAAQTTPWPHYAGTAEPFTHVHVIVDGREVCDVVATASGSFACDSAIPLAPGMHQVSAFSVDAAAWQSPSATPVGFVVSQHTPVLVKPAAGPVATSTPTFSGTAEPGTTASVLVNDVVVCTALVDAQGAWSCTAQSPLSDGLKSVRVVSDDGYGGQATSQDTMITIDTTAPVSPTVKTPASGDALLGGVITVSGTAEPGSTVQVSIDGQPACTVVADAQGHWSCNASNVSGGSHQVTATSTDSAGNVSTSSAGSGFGNTTQLPAPAITAPSAGDRIDGPTVAFSGTGTAGTTVTVVDDTGASLCSATVDASGAWACSGDEHAGNRSVTATATWKDLTSPASAPVAFTVLENAKLSGGGCSSTSSGPLSLGLLLAVALLLRRRS
jgi:uncharacterized repeat protein (TIGR01451 family)/uncharacterized repeat protein (TIGR02543 family)